jgi:hypothetical protein
VSWRSRARRDESSRRESLARRALRSMSASFAVEREDWRRRSMDGIVLLRRGSHIGRKERIAPIDPLAA